MKSDNNPTLKWIINDTDNFLRKSTSELNIPISKNDNLEIEKMVSLIDAAYNHTLKDKYESTPIAVAANQIGFDKNVIYIHFDDNSGEHKILLANPKITSYSKQIICLSTGEGCLSVKKKHPGYVPRYKKIIVEGYDILNKKYITMKAEDMLSICLQHEIDHLHGKLFYDHINTIEPWKKEKEWEII